MRELIAEKKFPIDARFQVGNQRITFYMEGGSEIEEYIKGVGWCLPTDDFHVDPWLDRYSALLKDRFRIDQEHRIEP